VMLDGVPANVTADMVRFGQALSEEIISTEFCDGTIYIDTEMDSALMAKGYAREVIRRIQEMRKEMNLDVEDFISARVQVQPEIETLLAAELDDIKYNTRSREFMFGEPETDDFAKVWDIAGEQFNIGTRKV